MGFRARKSINLGGGFRVNLSKSGIGLSAGVPGMRTSINSSGRRTSSVGIPGTGLSYRTDRGGSGAGGRSSSGSRRTAAAAPVALPTAPLFAPKEEKIFLKGVGAYMSGRHSEAVDLLRPISAEKVGALYFLASALAAEERTAEAIPAYEAVIASHDEIPDAMMRKYGIGGIARIAITEVVAADVPMSSLSAALTLAELYQRSGRSDDAIDLLEALGEAGAGATCALSLADLYAEAGAWQEVIRVTDGFATNDDDAGLATLLYRAEAMVELNMGEGALALTKEALRSSKRDEQLLRRGRYLRGRSYEAAGKAGMAAKEYEKVYAEDARYADVAKRLGRA